MKIKSVIFLIGLFFYTIVSAAIQTEVDKAAIATDEMVTLTIKSSDHLSLSPDIEPLKNDFYIVGTNQNSSFNIVNGGASYNTEWQIGLMPKHDGDIQIPALLVGKEKSAPQIIHVAATKTNSNLLPPTVNNDIYMETAVIPKEAFIQEQFVYNVKLYFSRSIGNAYLVPPDMPDAKITQNGQDIIYSVTKRGRYYRVLERSYLITPEKTGNFKIDSPVLKGYLESTGDRYDMYNFSAHNVRPIKIIGPIQKVTVKPKPANFTGRWFPAKKVTLKESWNPREPKFREGEPVTRTIEVSAIGATGEQIPNLEVSQSPTINSYAQPSKRETNTDNGQQAGQLKQDIVYIPTASGKVTLPAVSVKWWNSNAKKQEVTKLPAKTIQVLPALNQSPSSRPLSASPQSQAPSQSVKAVQPRASESHFIWPLIAVIAILLWIITMLAWRRQSRHTQQHPGKSGHSLKALHHNLKISCAQNNAKRTRDIFLNWSALHWSDQNLHNLADIVSLLEQEQATSLVEQIMMLEAVFYANHTTRWQGQDFWLAFSDYLSEHQKHHKEQADPLPPLYCSDT
jgi:hypothetical protein